MRVGILKPATIAPEAAEVLQSRFSVTEVDADSSSAEPEVEVLWTGIEKRVDAGLLGRFPRLKAVATPATGETHIDRRACADRGIRILTFRDRTAMLRDVRATAELTIGLLLALLRQIPAAHASVLEGEWSRSRFEGAEIFGKTAGIIGYGRLGRIVAGYFRAFGAEVVACDPAVQQGEEGVRLLDLPALLETADIVSVHASLDPGNQKMLGRTEFGRMKQGAVLINTARGELIDEEALLAALESGRLAGAALDVRVDEHELGSEADRLRDYARRRTNLILTPHIGGMTAESRRKTDVLLARLLVEEVP